MPPTQSAPAARLERVSSARLLVGDGIIVVGLLNERRHRIMATVFGVSRYDSNVLTLFVIAAFAAALRRAAAAPRTQVRKARSSPTAKGDTMIGAAVVKETLDSIAGHPSSDTSSAAALIAFAVVAHALRPAIARALRAVRQSVRGLKAAAHSIRAVMRRWGISPSNT
jgi:hypothetical protein